jgi:putative tricarboxylic transport membrane protein
MSDTTSRHLLSRKTAEIGFALLLLAFGGTIAFGARELETGWGGSGPEAGYFPFRIGVLIMLAAGVVLAQQLVRPGPVAIFLDRGAARNIALFSAPLLLLVAAIPLIGFYLAAAAYLLVAVGLIGRVALPVALGVLLGAPGVLFLLFEFAFRTPLPKGPLGPLLGMI